jgi:hypothetical protein
MYQRYLDEQGFPEGVNPPIFKNTATRKSTYGQYLKRTDPIAFNVGFEDWRREQENKKIGGKGK